MGHYHANLGFVLMEGGNCKDFYTQQCYYNKPNIRNAKTCNTIR